MSAPLLVGPLSHFSRDSLMLAGGKGANLGELLRMGFDVPLGFMITTAVYDLLLQESGAQAQLNKILETLNFDRPDSVPQVSQQIHHLFRQIPIPQQLTHTILKAYRELDQGA